MQIDAKTFARMPSRLRALFAKLPNPGSEEVLRAFPESDARPPGSVIKRESAAGTRGNALGAESRAVGSVMLTHGDSGSAARFFYAARPDEPASRLFYTSKADKADRLGSSHPTVKPVDLIAYLARLITPPGGTILDPFAGSGTTGMAAMREGFNAVLIEREAEYVADIRRRLAHVSGQDAPLFAQAAP